MEKHSRSKAEALSAPAPERKFSVDRLRVEIYKNRNEMGQAAGRAVGRALGAVLSKKGKAAVCFAAAPSQNEFLKALTPFPEIAWEKVAGFHLDEYVGLPPEAPQGFGPWLRSRLFDVVHLGAVHFLNGNASDPQEECARYAALLKAHPLDIACLGIGENGHLAFNDPPDADFKDPKAVKVVALDKRSREQQVHDGCFKRLADVPCHALTLTIPACVSAGYVSCVVPGPTKAAAVQRALQGPVDSDCPASILRQHPNAVLYLDRESAKLLA